MRHAGVISLKRTGHREAQTLEQLSQLIELGCAAAGADLLRENVALGRKGGEGSDQLGGIAELFGLRAHGVAARLNLELVRVPRRNGRTFLLGFPGLDFELVAGVLGQRREHQDARGGSGRRRTPRRDFRRAARVRDRKSAEKLSCPPADGSEAR